MSPTSTPGKRICYECGHTNSGISLFCAECGASLNDESTDRQNIESTTTFRPASTGQETINWDGGPQDPHATAEFQPQTDTASTQATPAWDHKESRWSEPVDTIQTSGFYEPESLRGLVLGWIASFLIVLVIGFFIWSTILSQGFRDSVIGFFS